MVTDDVMEKSNAFTFYSITNAVGTCLLDQSTYSGQMGNFFLESHGSLGQAQKSEFIKRMMTSYHERKSFEN